MILSSWLSLSEIRTIKSARGIFDKKLYEPREKNKGKKNSNQNNLR